MNIGRFVPATLAGAAMLAAMAPGAAQAAGTQVVDTNCRNTSTSWVIQQVGPNGSYKASGPLCARLYKVTNDGSSTRDYYGLKAYTTQNFKIHKPADDDALYDERFVLTAKPTRPADRRLEDWEPKSDSDYGACGSASFALDLGPVGFSLPLSLCSKVDITSHGSNPGRYTMKWSKARISNGYSGQAGFGVSINVPQGQRPRWTVAITFPEWGGGDLVASP